MGLTKKKLAAVTSAVAAYIKTEEEAAALAAQAGGMPGAAVEAPSAMAPAAAVAMNAWGVAGRTDQMQGRTLMQLRVFR